MCNLDLYQHVQHAPCEAGAASSGGYVSNLDLYPHVSHAPCAAGAAASGGYGCNLDLYQHGLHAPCEAGAASSGGYASNLDFVGLSFCLPSSVFVLSMLVFVLFMWCHVGYVRVLPPRPFCDSYVG